MPLLNYSKLSKPANPENVTKEFTKLKKPINLQQVADEIDAINTNNIFRDIASGKTFELKTQFIKELVTTLDLDDQQLHTLVSLSLEKEKMRNPQTPLRSNSLYELLFRYELDKHFKKNQTSPDGIEIPLQTQEHFRDKLTPMMKEANPQSDPQQVVENILKFLLGYSMEKTKIKKFDIGLKPATAATTKPVKAVAELTPDDIKALGSNLSNMAIQDVRVANLIGNSDAKYLGAFLTTIGKEKVSEIVNHHAKNKTPGFNSNAEHIKLFLKSEFAAVKTADILWGLETSKSRGEKKAKAIEQFVIEGNKLSDLEKELGNSKPSSSLIEIANAHPEVANLLNNPEVYSQFKEIETISATGLKTIIETNWGKSEFKMSPALASKIYNDTPFYNALSPNIKTGLLKPATEYTAKQLEIAEQLKRENVSSIQSPPPAAAPTTNIVAAPPALVEINETNKDDAKHGRIPRWKMQGDRFAVAQTQYGLKNDGAPFGKYPGKNHQEDREFDGKDETFALLSEKGKRAALEKTFDAMQKKHGNHREGSTLTVCAISGNEIIAANAGDSNAYLISVNTEGNVVTCKKITTEHDLDNAQEAQRIRDMGYGGEIIAGRLHKRNEGLRSIEVTRALGDEDFRVQGLTHKPTISTTIIAPPPGGKTYLLMGSDAIEEPLSNAKRKDVTDAANFDLRGIAALQKGKIPSEEYVTTLFTETNPKNGSLLDHTTGIIERLRKLDCGDNATAILVDVTPPADPNAEKTTRIFGVADGHGLKAPDAQNGKINEVADGISGDFIPTLQQEVQAQFQHQEQIAQPKVITRQEKIQSAELAPAIALALLQNAEKHGFDLNKAEDLESLKNITRMHIDKPGFNRELLNMLANNKADARINNLLQPVVSEILGDTPLPPAPQTAPLTVEANPLAPSFTNETEQRLFNTYNKEIAPLISKSSYEGFAEESALPEATKTALSNYLKELNEYSSTTSKRNELLDDAGKNIRNYLRSHGEKIDDDVAFVEMRAHGDLEQRHAQYATDENEKRQMDVKITLDFIKQEKLNKLPQEVNLKTAAMDNIQVADALLNNPANLKELCGRLEKQLPEGAPRGFVGKDIAEIIKHHNTSLNVSPILAVEILNTGDSVGGRYKLNRSFTEEQLATFTNIFNTELLYADIAAFKDQPVNASNIEKANKLWERIQHVIDDENMPPSVDKKALREVNIALNKRMMDHYIIEEKEKGEALNVARPRINLLNAHRQMKEISGTDKPQERINQINNILMDLRNGGVKLGSSDITPSSGLTPTDNNVLKPLETFADNAFSRETKLEDLKAFNASFDNIPELQERLRTEIKFSSNSLYTSALMEEFDTTVAPIIKNLESKHLTLKQLSQKDKDTLLIFSDKAAVVSNPTPELKHARETVGKILFPASANLEQTTATQTPWVDLPEMNEPLPPIPEEHVQVIKVQATPYAAPKSVPDDSEIANKAKELNRQLATPNFVLPAQLNAARIAETFKNSSISERQDIIQYLTPQNKTNLINLRTKYRNLGEIFGENLLASEAPAVVATVLPQEPRKLNVNARTPAPSIPAETTKAETINKETITIALDVDGTLYDNGDSSKINMGLIAALKEKKTAEEAKGNKVQFVLCTSYWIDQIPKNAMEGTTRLETVRLLEKNGISVDAVIISGSPYANENTLGEYYATRVRSIEEAAIPSAKDGSLSDGDRKTFFAGQKVTLDESDTPVEDLEFNTADKEILDKEDPSKTMEKQNMLRHIAKHVNGSIIMWDDKPQVILAAEHVNKETADKGVPIKGILVNMRATDPVAENKIYRDALGLPAEPAPKTKPAATTEIPKEKTNIRAILDNIFDAYKKGLNKEKVDSTFKELMESHWMLRAAVWLGREVRDLSDFARRSKVPVKKTTDEEIAAEKIAFELDNMPKGRSNESHLAAESVTTAIREYKKTEKTFEEMGATIEKYNDLKNRFKEIDEKTSEKIKKEDVPKILQFTKEVIDLREKMADNTLITAIDRAHVTTWLTTINFRIEQNHPPKTSVLTIAKGEIAKQLEADQAKLQTMEKLKQEAPAAMEKESPTLKNN